ncbi:MAG TPA: hypothetical protein VHG28_11425, partial [Longimicrobiaceae bacterium]|nr:hypothetical protein [Longimicrobiaceae bacterium]
MIRRLAATLGLLAGLLVLSGHVGSPNVFFEGSAGPYPVRVTVRPPEVIPGRAEISVRVMGEGARRVTVRPVRWDLGTQGAPRPDEAHPVEGEPRLWSAQLWLMDPASYSVHVAVEGAAGSGRVIVPIPAVATRVREMPRGLGILLAGLGIFLGVGLLTLVGAAVREAVLPPGEEPDRQRVRRAWIARAAAVPVLALVLLAGARWWSAEAAEYGENVYQPPQVETAVAVRDGSRLLTLRVTDPAWLARSTPLIPDHGKLAHLFLVREPGLDAFAHVHPARADSVTFTVALPPLPAGRYRVYADVVHESGFVETLVDTTEFPVPGTGGGGVLRPDPDDSWLTGAAAAGAVARLADGSTMTWERGEGAPEAGREAA